MVSLKRGLLSPFAVAIGPSGIVYVGEQQTGSVGIFTGDWQLQAKLGTGNNEFLNPTDIALDPDPQSGNVYVTDGDANIVNVYQPSGEFLFGFGGLGTAPGQFDFPSAIYVSTGGEVIVGDQNNDRVQIFNRSGGFLRSFGSANGGSFKKKFGSIQGLTCDDQGRIYMADAFQGYVRVFDSLGVSLSTIGSFGEGPGQLRTPMSVCIDSYKRLFVSSFNSGRIEVYGLDAYTDPGQIPSDNDAPTINMSSPAMDTTNVDPIPVVVSFSEPVIGFDTAAVATGNASIINFTGSGANYSFGLLPAGQGIVTANIPAGMCMDVSGNENAAGAFTAVYDSIPPVPVIAGDRALTNSTRTLTVDFGETVAGFDLSDLLVSNATAGNVQPPGPSSSYSVEILGSGTATVSVSIVAGGATDQASNPNGVLASPFVFPFDGEGPIATVTQINSSPTGADVVAFHVSFSEYLGDALTTANVRLAPGLLPGTIALSGTGKDYTVSVDLADVDADGTIGISVSDTGVSDLAGNLCTGGLSPVYVVQNWHGFSVEPVDATLYEGDSHVLTVTPDLGAVVPNFQWKWDGVGKNDAGSKVVQNGPLTQEWFLPSLTLVNRGMYWCEVTYDGVVHESAHASLSVDEHLQITIAPVGGQMNIGDYHSLTVATSGGHSPLTYTWKKDGTVVEGVFGPSYTINSFTPEDSGLYTVEVIDAGTDRRSATAELTLTSSLPLLDTAGLVLLAGIIAAGGVLQIRKRK